MGNSCEISSHFITVVAASLRRGASAVGTPRQHGDTAPWLQGVRI